MKRNRAWLCRSMLLVAVLPSSAMVFAQRATGDGLPASRSRSLASAAGGEDPVQVEPLPWRIDRYVDSLPWLRLSGRQRTRFESLNGQFRAGNRPTTEDQWFLRTSLRGDFDFGEVGGSVEIMDSRAYGGGGDAQAGTAFSNPFDVVEANVTVPFSGGGRLLAGRYTMSVGSRRFIIRNGFRNTVNTFTGLDYLWQDEQRNELRAFWTMPVRRRPFDAPSLRDNDFAWDDQDEDLQFFGVFGRRRLDAQTELEGFVYGLHEGDSQMLGRRLVTPGVRLHRPKQPGSWFGEVEGAFQFGQSRLSGGGSRLDHAAWFAHASVGYVWDDAWQTTLRLAYDHASGDRDPTDGVNQRFDRLFGAPRFEYSPTGLWGAIQRSNFRTPEVRVSIRPTSRWYAMLAWRDFRLAAARDVWVGAGVQDPSGQSGTHIGQQLELRVRYDLLPGNTHIEVGGAYLFAGAFLERAPNAATRGDSRYGYFEVVSQF